MAYTLSSLISKVQTRVKDTSFSTDQITEFLNDAQNDLFNEYDLHFQEASQTYTLTPNVADITNGAGLPSDFTTAYSLTNTTSGYGFPLFYRSFREMDDFLANPTSITAYGSGAPTLWYLYNGTICVFPTPDKAYTLLLRYKKRPTLLTSDSDTITVPQEFEEILILGAAFRVMEVKDNYDQAAYLKERMEEQARKLVGKYNRNQTGRPTMMRINRNAVGS